MQNIKQQYQLEHHRQPRSAQKQHKWGLAARKFAHVVLKRVSKEKGPPREHKPRHGSVTLASNRSYSEKQRSEQHHRQQQAAQFRKILRLKIDWDYFYQLRKLHQEHNLYPGIVPAQQYCEPYAYTHLRYHSLCGARGFPTPSGVADNSFTAYEEGEVVVHQAPLKGIPDCASNIAGNIAFETDPRSVTPEVLKFVTPPAAAVSAWEFCWEDFRSTATSKHRPGVNCLPGADCIPPRRIALQQYLEQQCYY